MKKIFTSLFFFVFSISIFFAQELPRADQNNCFYLLPLFEDLKQGIIPYADKDYQMRKLLDQMGPQNLYHRLGFSMIYHLGRSEYEDIFYLLKKHHLHIGVIFDLQSHTRLDYRNFASKDFRLYQWRINGKDWEGEDPDDLRDYRIPTSSRYAEDLVEYNKEAVVKWTLSLKSLMDKYPGVVAIINGPIEEELTGGPGLDSTQIGDYSPYAITEFRDWLRHTGLYDATTGKYAGEGASHYIIGDLINFNGVLRSQFYDDPTPDDNNGTGSSFNDFFCTDFMTWSLRYWDLVMFDEPITDPNFDPTPESGKGYIVGGFHAPRVIDENDKYWTAWSYENRRHDNIYPEGNPENPAFGFRQNLVRNYIRDEFDIIASLGIPRNMMFAHQVPVELISDERELSSASPIWTGYLEKSQTVGITKFHHVDPNVVNQYADKWGIFEWHPSPNDQPDDQHLYDRAFLDINEYYSNKCQSLWPGWWRENLPTLKAPSTGYYVNDSRFADAAKDFMLSTKEHPYYLQDAETPDYVPPVVAGVKSFVTSDNNLIVKWSPEIWTDLVPFWTDWRKFAYFKVEWSLDGQTWSDADTTSKFNIVIPVENNSYYTRVRAVSTTDQKGAWSAIAESIPIDANATFWEFIAEFDTINADPDLTNLITLNNLDDSIDIGALSISIEGDGALINTLPDNYNSIEEIWRFNLIDDIKGSNDLVNIREKGGVVSAIVTDVDPYLYLKNSNINGDDLKYISFRFYSSKSSRGSIFWFKSGINYRQNFDIVKGWQTIHFNNLENWSGQFEKIRIDPGDIPNAKIIMDWVAIGSNAISDQLVTDVLCPQYNKVEMLTSPDNNAGSYSIKVNYKGKQDSIKIYATLENKNPEIAILYPTKDTLIEKGAALRINVFTLDKDGVVDSVVYFKNNQPFYHSFSYPFSFDGTFDVAGDYQVTAEAYDNFNGASSSNTINVKVVEQTPYNNLHILPGVIEAEDYDIGGQNISYKDIDDVNEGGEYRNDGVDIGLNNNIYYVGWTEEGEWLEYTVNSDVNRKLDLKIWVSSDVSNGEFHIENNDIVVTPHQFVKSTGGLGTYKQMIIKDITIREGVQKIKIVIDKGGFNIDKFEFTEIATSLPKISNKPNKLNFYPNPTSNSITIVNENGQESKIEIYDISGTLNKVINIDSNNSHRIDVSYLKSGVYFIRLINDDGNVLQGKFIKMSNRK